MTINEAQDEIISEFEFLDDWLDKYQEIIDKGMNAKIDPKYKTPEYLIEGCQSKVWIHAEYKDGKVIDESESNTDIAGGIAVMLATRSNGMRSMLKQMKLYAMAFKSKSES